MRRFRFAVLAVVSAVLVLAFAQSALAAGPTGWVVSQLTTGSAVQMYPRVSGDRVAWIDNDTASVWTWKPGEASHQISAAGDDTLGYVSVDGDHVVWLGAKAAVGHTVHLWTPQSGTTSATTIFHWYDADQNSPKVSGNRIAWVDTPLDDPVSHVYTWSVGDSAPTTVSTNTYPIYDPISLSGSRIAWTCCTLDGHATNLVMRDMSGGPQVPLTTHTGTSYAAYSARISPTLVACIDDTTDWFVRAWTSADTSVVVGVGVNGDEDWQVSGSRIVWRQPDAGGAGQIATWKVGDAQPSILTTGGTGVSHVHPKVDGDRVVWEERTGGQQVIMTWTPASGVTTVSSTAYVAGEPYVSGDHIVWQGYTTGGTTQIYSAVPRSALTATAFSKLSVSPSKPSHTRRATYTTSLTAGGTGVSGAHVKLAFYQQSVRSVRKKVRGTWKTVKVTSWHLRKTFSMSRGAAAGSYVTKITIAFKGVWKATASATVPAGYSAPTAKSLVFTVK